MNGWPLQTSNGAPRTAAFQAYQVFARMNVGDELVAVTFPYEDRADAQRALRGARRQLTRWFDWAVLDVVVAEAMDADAALELHARIGWL